AVRDLLKADTASQQRHAAALADPAHDREVIECLAHRLEHVIAAAVRSGQHVVEVPVVAQEALAAGPAADLRHERVLQLDVRARACPRFGKLGGQVPACAEELWCEVAQPVLAYSIALEVVDAERLPATEQVDLLESYALEPEPVVGGDAHDRACAPLVLGIDHDVTAPIRLRYAEHVDPGKEAVGAEESLRLTEHERVVAVARIEEQLAQDRVLARTDVQLVGRAVRPAEARAQVGV